MNTTPQSQLNHSLLRPCVLHILRAAGYQGTRPSVLDTITDLAARYILVLAQSAAAHAADDDEAEISVVDVRLAMQECGALLPEKVIEDQIFDWNEPEDTRGVDGFIAWAMGPENREIRRVALESADGSKDDYLAGLFTKTFKLVHVLTVNSFEKETWHHRRRRLQVHQHGPRQSRRASSCKDRGRRNHQH